MKKIISTILLMVFACTFYACGNNSLEKNSSPEQAGNVPQTPSQAGNTGPEEYLHNRSGQPMLDEFFVTIGTAVSRSDIENIAKNIGLYIDYRNSGTGMYTYRIALEEKVASTIYREKGSHITVSFNGLEDNTLTEITYFDEERMVAGYWSTDTGYLLADYNYPQIVYRAENTDKAYSRIPVSDPKEIIDYSFYGEPGENLLEVLFALITPETTKDDLLAFVDSYSLSYNSRGVGNEQIIAYCYEIGDKFGESGSYLTFSVDNNNLVTRITYLYYPANYKNGYRASFYSESYAERYSTPSGFVLESEEGLTEYQSAEELLTRLHN